MNIRFRTGIAVLGLAAIAFTVGSAAAQTGVQETSGAAVIAHKPPKDKDKSGDPPRVSRPPKGKDKGGDPVP